MIGVPWVALAIAWRSEPGPLSAVLVTTSGWLSNGSDVDRRARDPRSPRWSVAGRLPAVMAGTPSLLYRSWTSAGLRAWL